MHARGIIIYDIANIAMRNMEIHLEQKQAKRTKLRAQVSSSCAVLLFNAYQVVRLLVVMTAGFFVSTTSTASMNMAIQTRKKISP